MPALFIQWEGIGKTTKDGRVKLPTNATKTLNMWYKQYACGRIIIIWDGLTAPSGILSVVFYVCRYLLLSNLQMKPSCRFGIYHENIIVLCCSKHW